MKVCITVDSSSQLEEHKEEHQQSFVLMRDVGISAARRDRAKNLPSSLCAIEFLSKSYDVCQPLGRAIFEGKERIVEMDPRSLDA